jgi:hypothetical protein
VLRHGSLTVAILTLVVLTLTPFFAAPSHARVPCRWRATAARPTRPPEARRNRSTANIVDGAPGRARLCGARSETRARPRLTRGAPKIAIVGSVV